METSPIFCGTWELGLLNGHWLGREAPHMAPLLLLEYHPIFPEAGVPSPPDARLVSSPRPLTAGSQHFLFPALSEALRNFREWWMEKRKALI